MCKFHKGRVSADATVAGNLKVETELELGAKRVERMSLISLTSCTYLTQLEILERIVIVFRGGSRRDLLTQF